MIIDCISDVHGMYPELKGGDLLLLAGDYTARDGLIEHSDALEWMFKGDYKKKILIAGNHDNFLQKNPNFYSKSEIIYLCDSGTEFEGLKIWGSPWTKTFQRMNPLCKAFTCDTEDQLFGKFVQIPNDIDILITHCPPYGILDKNIHGEHCGSTALLETLDRVKPKLLIFGHIHEQGGRTMLYKHLGPNTICVNASIQNENYDPVNYPVTIVL